MQESILSNVNDVFSVMMDETTDVSGQEQATIVLRYVKEDVHEDFVAFLHARNLTGTGLAELLVTTVENLGLNMSNCRGLGLDGASAMMGKFKGCAAVIADTYPLAKPVHCFNHRLNLVITKSCDVKEIKLAIQVITDVYNYIYKSNMRRLRFTEKIQQSGSRKTKLVNLCTTRWIERHDAVLVFVEFLPLLSEFLEEEMQLDGSAGLLRAAIQESRCLVGLVVTESVLAYTVHTSRNLQAKSMDLVSAYSHIRKVIDMLQNLRTEAEKTFSNLLCKVNNLLIEVGSSSQEVTTPRLCGRQSQRGNHPATSAEEYYRRSVYLPFLDQVISELKQRFGDDTIPTALSLSTLMRGTETDTCVVLKAAELYSADIESRVILEAELQRWVWYAPSFDTLKETKIYAEREIYPNVAKLLCILMALPVTNAEAERSFSALKRLKTYLRNTIGQDRLNGLALLASHKDISISIDTVIKRFTSKNRRIMLTE